MPLSGEVTPVLDSGGGRRMALEMGVPFLGEIPIDPAVTIACDNGCATVALDRAGP